MSRKTFNLIVAILATLVVGGCGMAGSSGVPPATTTIKMSQIVTPQQRGEAIAFLKQIEAVPGPERQQFAEQHPMGRNAVIALHDKQITDRYNADLAAK